MLRFVAKRLGYMLITLFVVITLTFIAMKAIPGDPIGAKYEKATPEVKANIEAFYGLDQPPYIQYITYLKGLLKGELGISIAMPGRTADSIIVETFPASFRLGITALVIGLIVGVGCGALAGLRHNGPADIIVTVITTIGVSVPNFVLVSLLQYTLAYRFPIFPPQGWDNSGSWLQGWEFVVLPAAALSFSTWAIYTKYMREAVIDVMGEEYVMLARAKGLPAWYINARFILRNSILPIVTISAQQAAMLFTGSFVIENIFSIPGIGRYFIQSVMQHDYTMIMAVTIFYSVLFILATLVMDVLYYVLDPRLRGEIQEAAL